MRFDWEGYKRERAQMEITREDERELINACARFVLRLIGAIIRGKKIVRSWWTARDGSKCFDICTRTKFKANKDIECEECYQMQRRGSKMVRLESILLEYDEPASGMCKECADEITDKNRYEEHEKKRADILRCRWSA